MAEAWCMVRLRTRTMAKLRTLLLHSDGRAALGLPLLATLDGAELTLDRLVYALARHIELDRERSRENSRLRRQAARRPRVDPGAGI